MHEPFFLFRKNACKLKILGETNRAGSSPRVPGVELRHLIGLDRVLPMNSNYGVQLALKHNYVI
jgi:hypothetical protein